MAQKAVNTKQAFGVEGEFYDSSYKVVATYVAATAVKVGAPVWFTADGEVTATFATGAKLAGIVVNPKEYSQTAFTATLEVPANTPVAVASKGHIIVKAGGTIAVGDSLVYTAGAYQQGTTNVIGKCVITGATTNELTVIEL